MKVREYVIYAEDRTGSSTLSRILSAHPDTTCVFEPFNLKKTAFPGAVFKGPITTVEELQAALDDVYDNYGGFKHVIGGAGNPLREPVDRDTGVELNKTLLNYRSPNIIYLVRANRLKRLVSRYIAQQSNVWDLVGVAAERRQQLEAAQIQPLTFERVEEDLGKQERSANYFRMVIEEAGVAPLKVTYEEIFEKPLDEAIAATDRVLVHLGLDPNPSEEFQAEKVKLLDPKDNQVNSTNTYPLIPNVQEIEERFGNDETGYLFK
jgi:LPS sulfotransferase NodH